METKASAKAPESTCTGSLQDVNEANFPQSEEKVLKYWNEIKAFETSLKLSKGRPEYTFYDGPPFATGLPHYGHILAGTIKDTVTRYAHQLGYHVERRFGWDCHGLPVEYEIDQTLGIKSKEDVLKMGVDKYNAACRAIVLRYTAEWESRVTRMGRWIDFKNDYKTMDPSFMESVWWCFKTMHEKGLIYKGFKVMPYSWGCTTPLSNFEVSLNYKNVVDPAVVVTFPLESDPSTAFLAWTTTPWTLPSNLALCVNAGMKYVKIRDHATGAKWILAASRLAQMYPPKKQKAAAADKTDEKVKASVGGTKKTDNKSKKAAHAKEAAAAAETEADADSPKEYDVLQEFKGAELKGMRYQPLFTYFTHLKDKSFYVLCDDYVTDDSGTGIVHQAPAFGEDDYRICLAAGITTKGKGVLCPVDDNGCFTAEVKDFAGMNVKEADKHIVAMLKKTGRLVQHSQIEHSYPFCWRSDTPLIYRAVPSWFVNVESFKDRILKNNDETYWVPNNVRVARFANWLKDARDWAISRNRYWGTPLPIWASEDDSEMVVVGSIEELKQLSGVTDINDLHKDKMDHITIPSKTGKGVLRRVPEVFDCWFESGAMPYAQQHYPFENKEQFDKGFPADFIAEGLDQTRGWFYTLMVISTALFDKPAFRHLIVNGLVLAADGQKMSKRKKNYPDPMEVVNRYGADALRIYLINSPVVRAEPLRFKESGVQEVVKNVFLPWYNAYRFFVENAKRFEMTTGEKFVANSAALGEVNNVMDKWILAALNTLIANVRRNMQGESEGKVEAKDKEDDQTKGYLLYKVIPELLDFIEQLTNWYVRLNRKRLKGAGGQRDCWLALNTLFEVLYATVRLMAPFTPFLVETMYQNLKFALPDNQREQSVHFLLIPTVNEAARNPKIEAAVKNMQKAILLGRTAREERGVSLKQPLREAVFVAKDPTVVADVKMLESYIKDELNVKALRFSSSMEEHAKQHISADRQALGKRLRGALGTVEAALQNLTPDALKTLNETGFVTVAGEKIAKSEVCMQWEFRGNKDVFQAAVNGDSLMLLNTELDQSLAEEGLAREIVTRVQKLRKAAGLLATDSVDVFYDVRQAKSSAELPAPASKPGKERKGLPRFEHEPVAATATKRTGKENKAAKAEAAKADAKEPSKSSSKEAASNIVLSHVLAKREWHELMASTLKQPLRQLSQQASTASVVAADQSLQVGNELLVLHVTRNAATKSSAAPDFSALNAHFAKRSYAQGFTASSADADLFAQFTRDVDATAYPNLARWFEHMNSFDADTRKRWPLPARA